MHIVHVASELAPLAKVGGLADVVLGLCRELSWKGNDVDIIIPKYDCLDSSQIRDLSIEIKDLMSFYNGEWFHNTIWVGWVENLKVYFIEPHHPRHFFDRGCFYGCDDDIERYLYFCRIALEFLFKRGIKPDILHLHDWQTAAIAPLYNEMYKPLGFSKSKIVFTVHNFDYQGRCAPFDIQKIGLDPAKLATPAKLQDNIYPEALNLLKGAVVYADYVTTVSPNYAKEVLTPEGGRGMESTLNLYKSKFCGILNGIDYSYWNPEIDRYLPAHFSSRESPRDKGDRDTIDKKAFIKNVLRERLGLAEMYAPLVGCIARLVPQKGIDLIKHTLMHTIKKGGQFVLLGSSPIPSIAHDFQALKQKYADHPQVYLALHHQEELAHLIFAASDMFIVPSLFEPCGLTQMISLKYGAIPIVRHTGGLADTIVDVELSGKPFNETNGFVFNEPNCVDLECALDRAFAMWFNDPDKWRKLMLNGMNVDFSWNKPSNQYLELYKKLIEDQNKQ